MTPPRSPDTDLAGGGGPEAVYDAIVAEIAEVQGVINVAEARIVSLTARALEVGVSGGTALTPERWLEWQAGMSGGRAADTVKLASRSAELPHTIAALEAGDLSLDQAARIARYVLARYDESAAGVARFCTVRQLEQALPWFRDRKKPKPGGRDEDRSVATGHDERGWWIRGRLDEAEGAIVDQALKAMREDLKRQAKAETPEGGEPHPVTAADALVALAETALQAGEAARPGTDRYLVHAHLEAGADGTIELMTHLGLPLPDGERRHILCDAKLRGVLHQGTTPLGAGRVTRAINRRLRRAVEHRDGGCAVPGCGRTHGLEIHHIWHWEDGGPTETWNLITLCAFHHRTHHLGTLGIEGNADAPRHTAPASCSPTSGADPSTPRATPPGPHLASMRPPRQRTSRPPRRPSASPRTPTTDPPANASTAGASTSTPTHPTSSSTPHHRPRTPNRHRRRPDSGRTPPHLSRTPRPATPPSTPPAPDPPPDPRLHPTHRAPGPRPGHRRVRAAARPGA